MLPEYINWENVQKYHIISDIVEGGAWEEQSGKLVQQLNFF